MYDDDHQKLFNDFKRRAADNFRSSVTVFCSAHSRAAALHRVKLAMSESPMSGQAMR